MSRRSSDLKFICRPAGNGATVSGPEGTAEGKEEALKLYANFTGVLHKRGYLRENDLDVACGSMNLWNGGRDSNLRRPAWESVTSPYLQHLGVSAALFRLCQVSPNQLFPDTNLAIEVRSRYIFPPFVPRFVRHPTAKNNKGSRCHASLPSIGVKLEYCQWKYTPTCLTNSRGKFSQ